MNQAPKPKGGSRNGGPSPVVVVIAVVAVVAVAAIIAVIIAGGGSSSSTDTDTATVTTVPVPAGELDERIPEVLRREVRPVEIIGEPLPLYTGQDPDPAVGMAPPTLIGEDGTGYVHTISGAIDAPVLLLFLAHWCPACNQELPLFVDLSRQGLIPEDLQVYAVLTALDPSRPGFPPIEWLQDAGWSYDYVVDMPDMDRDAAWVAGEAFGLSAFPYAVLIDDGVVVERWSGISETEELLARLAAVSEAAEIAG